METLVQWSHFSLGSVLVFFRFTAFFVASPFPGASAPAMARIVLAAGLAWAAGPHAPFSGSMADLVTGMLVEVFFGLAAGFLLTLAMHAFASAGEIAGTQMGLATPGFIDPNLPAQLNVMGRVFSFTALGLFVFSGGVENLLAFLFRSVELIPPGAWAVSPDGFEVAQRGGSELFQLGLRVASPIMASVFGAQLLLMVLSKAVPSLNMFIEGPALTVSTGILGLIAAAHTFVPMSSDIFAHIFEFMATTLFPR